MGTPAWWNVQMPELVNKREFMQNVEKWQTMYVRYKCQPEAQVTQSGWDLSISQRYADQLALEEQQPYLSEESLLYNGLAPTGIALRIIEAPAEFAVPVKQDRRLTPNFKVRVDVSYKNRCSFPLTLKAYVITQQEKDSVPEWVPDDFLDPDLPQRKPVTELKGTTVITHHFEGNTSGSPKAGGTQKQSQNQLGLFGGALDAAAAQALLGKGADPSLLASLGWSGDLDPRMVEQVLQETARGGAVDPTTAAALAAAAQLGGASGSAALDALSSALGGSAAAAAAAAAAAGGGVDGHVSHDYEFSSVELVKPTRMNKVYLVFACSILEQDLMFVVYNIPTVGICRAEQRQKACQKLGISYSELGGNDLFQQDNPLGLGAQQMRGISSSVAAMAAIQQQQAAAHVHHQQQRKRGSAQQGWDPSLMGTEALSHRAFAGADGLLGLGGSDVNLAALAGDVNMGAMGLGAMQVDGMLQGLGADAGMGMFAGMGGMVGAAAGLQGLPVGTASGAGAQSVEARTRMALRELLVEEYESTGLHRKLSPLDLQALESQAGFPSDSSNKSVSISQQQWDEFMGQYRMVLRLLRQISTVWNVEDPCIVAGFDMDRLGTVQALSLEPAGTFICRFSMSQPGCLVLSCRVAPGHPNADGDGLLHAIIKTDDLYERRVETWIRDFPGATHILDVYKNKRVDKRKVFASNYTRLRAMDMLEAYDDILI